jgi:hypothetical protein
MLIAMEIHQRSACTSGFADDRFVDVARIDVARRWRARSAADWIVRDRLLVHLHIDHRATRPGSRDSVPKRVVLEIHVRCPVGMEIHRSGGTGGTEVGRERGDVSFDVGRHVLATGGKAVNAHASALTHRYVRR